MAGETYTEDVNVYSRCYIRDGNKLHAIQYTEMKTDGRESDITDGNYWQSKR